MKKILIVNLMILSLSLLFSNMSPKLERYKDINGKWGFKTDGVEAIPAQYDEVDDFKDGIAKVGNGGDYPTYELIDKNGNKITSMPYNHIGDFGKNGLASVEFISHISSSSTTECGFINKKDTIVIRKATYKTCGDFTPNGLAYVCSHESRLCGFINTKAEVIIPFKYTSLGNFSSNGLASACIDINYERHCGYINKENQMVIKAQYAFTNDFKERKVATFAIQKYHENMDSWLDYGVIDSNGKELVSPQYDEVGEFSNNGLLRVKKNGLWSYINEKGKEIIAPKFENAWDFQEDNLALVDINGTLLYIDAKGNVIKGER